jgi:hypothetical protein
MDTDNTRFVKVPVGNACISGGYEPPKDTRTLAQSDRALKTIVSSINGWCSINFGLHNESECNNAIPIIGPIFLTFDYNRGPPSGRDLLGYNHGQYA